MRVNSIRYSIMAVAVTVYIIACVNAGIPPISPPTGDGYLPYSAMIEGLQTLAKNHPNFMELSPITYENGNEVLTHEGHTIYRVRFSDNVGTDEGEPDIFVLLGIHAREWAAIGAGYKFIHHIATSYDGSDPTITDLVDRSELHIIPVANPDGYVHTWRSLNPEYRYWRKNRRKNADGSFGVDLNRNWSYQWGYNTGENNADPKGWVYRGTAAFSEPETQGIRDTLKDLSDLKLFFDVHSTGETVLHPWSYDGRVPNDVNLLDVGNVVVKAMNNVHSRQYTLSSKLIVDGQFQYYAAGVSEDFVYHTYDVPSYTIETRLEGSERNVAALFHPPESSVEPTFEELSAGILAGWKKVLLP